MRAHFFVISLAACAAHTSTPAVVDYRPISGEPAPAAAALYTDCLADAIAAHRVVRATDSDTTLLMFTCTGTPARAFYDGLADYTARIRSQFVQAGKTYRPTARVHHDLFAVDYCASDGTAQECVITLNAGEFLR